MSYRITYDQIRVKETASGKQLGIKTIFWLAAGLMVGCMMTAYWEQVWTYLLPGDPAVTATAINGMVENLRSGIGAGEAITTFCREIIAGAEIA